MKKLGFSEEQQLALTLLISEKKAEAQEELESLTASSKNTVRRQDGLETEIDVLESISSMLSERIIVIGREIKLKIPALKFDGVVAVDPHLYEGTIYCTEYLYEEGVLKFKMMNSGAVIHVEEFIIDSDGAAYIPVRLSIAGEDVMAHFTLEHTLDYKEFPIVIGRNPLKGMFMDISYPDDTIDDSGIFLYEGFGEG